MSVIVAILYLVAASVLVSFIVAAFARTRSVVLVGSFIITELLFLILEYHGIASSSDAAEIFLVPVWLAIVIAPFIILTSLACFAITARLRRGKRSP
jgi:hypothetical protein